MEVFPLPYRHGSLILPAVRAYDLSMIGSVLGVALGWLYLSSSWEPLKDGDSVFSGFGQAVFVLLICLAIGLFIFPRTIGMMFTPAIFIAPFAFAIGWVKNGFLYGLSLLAFGLISWGITQIIAKVRPSST